MPLTLDQTAVINDTIVEEEITSFTVSETQQIIYVIYDRKNSNGDVIIPDVSHTIVGAEKTSCVARAEELVANGAGVYDAIKQAIYEYMPENGSIS